MRPRDLEKLLRSDAKRAVPVDLRDRLIAAIPPRGTPARKERRRPLGAWPLLAPAALAAALVIYLGASGRLGRPGATGGFDLKLVSSAYAAMIERIESRGAFVCALDSRSGPRENFEHIDPSLPFVPVKIWFELPSPRFPSGRMRIDKEERNKIFDGDTTLLHFVRAGEAKLWEGEVGLSLDRLHANPANWLSGLLPLDPARTRVDTLIAAGTPLTTLSVVEAGDWEAEPGARPSFYHEFDRRTVVTWETGTKALTGIEKYVRHQGREILVERLRSIDYRHSLPDSLFSLRLPSGVRPMAYADVYSSSYADLGPIEVTEIVLDAWRRRDWDSLRPFCDSEALIEWMAANELLEFTLTGPPNGTNYAGYKVPCELVFAGGGRPRARRTHLALRNDNEMGRYVYDGGL